jgi:4-aminobutyrate aminotransferase-like enzyme
MHVSNHCSSSRPVIKIKPPLVFGKVEADKLMMGIRSALQDVMKQLRNKAYSEVTPGKA